jgi:hypothetical protein
MSMIISTPHHCQRVGSVMISVLYEQKNTIGRSNSETRARETRLRLLQE